MTAPKKLGLAGRLAKLFIHSKLTPLLVLASIAVGSVRGVAAAARGGAADRRADERRVRPHARRLGEGGRSAHHDAARATAVGDPGVEYVYSTSSPGMATVIVRFKVGEDEERATVRLQQKLAAHMDVIPAGASPPLVKVRSIDDVPVLALTLRSTRYPATSCDGSRPSFRSKSSRCPASARSR